MKNYKVHFSAIERIDSAFFYAKEISERISKCYDEEFDDLNEAVKYAQETYVKYVCEENVDMDSRKDCAEYARQEIAKQFRTESIGDFSVWLQCAILEKTHLHDSDLWDLRQEVSLGSMYISDYENSYGIDAENVYDFFEGFCGDMERRAEEDGLEYGDFDDLFETYDNEEALLDYYYYLEDSGLDYYAPIYVEDMCEENAA